MDRLAVYGNATCPLETAVGFFKLCASQSCGKCTPCRIGLSRLTDDLESILAGKKVEGIVEHLMNVCQTLYETADCAIGFQAGRVGLFFADLIPQGISCGYEWAETHPQLEDNMASQMQWKNLDCSIHKRRAVFSKSI